MAFASSYLLSVGSSPAAKGFLSTGASDARDALSYRSSGGAALRAHSPVSTKAMAILSSGFDSRQGIPGEDWTTEHRPTASNSSSRFPDLRSSRGSVPAQPEIAFKEAVGSSLTHDDLWLQIRAEARRDSESEPALASYLYSTILAHRSLERSLAFHLANKISSSTLLSTHLSTLFTDMFLQDAEIRDAIRADLLAVKERDPACISYSHCMLNFKGYLACQTHRVAHKLWKQGRRSLALALHSRVSEVFQVDIHPAAKIGKGVLFDHATGVVVGETAEIGNNVSILHHVTLGGTGAMGGDRHPKVGDGVLIGAGATLLGPIVVGDCAKIGAGTLVLTDIPAHATMVGNPGRIIGGKDTPQRSTDIPSQTMDQISSFLDYVI